MHTRPSGSGIVGAHVGQGFGGFLPASADVELRADRANAVTASAKAARPMRNATCLTVPSGSSEATAGLLPPREPLVKRKDYILKLGTARVAMRVEEVRRIVDASTLEVSETKTQVDRHDVADCTIQLQRAIAFDGPEGAATTSRFVIVDGPIAEPRRPSAGLFWTPVA